MGEAWWRTAVFYQVFLRSFADSDGDGVGDLPGATTRLADLAALGVDAVVLSPLVTSSPVGPSDYRDVHPVLGSLADLDALLVRAHALGLRVIIELVPDLSRSDPAMRAAFEQVLRFWLDRGVDGFQVGVVHGLVEDPDQPPSAGSPRGLPTEPGDPCWDEEGVHDLYRSWRAVVDDCTAADPSRPRILYGGADVSVDLAVRAVRPGELHQTVNGAYLQAPWEPVALRRVIEDSLTAYDAVGAPPTWALSTRDVVRPASRFGYPADVQPRTGVGVDDPQPDAALGLRRARAAILLMLALPGSAHLYQGEELGLPEHTSLPDEARQDPSWERSGHTGRGREGCRVPLPWLAGIDGLGFTDGMPWLPQPDSFDALARNRQEEQPGSTLRLYVGALAFRRRFGLASGTPEWRSDAQSPVLDLTTAGLRVTVNLGASPVPLPDDAEVLLASEPLTRWQLEPDVAVWWRPLDSEDDPLDQA